jgi:membrane protein implicated in regulation of membrane protease activity
MGWLYWLGAAFGLGLIELLVPEVVVIMLAGGALAGSVAAAFGAPIWAQFLVFGVASVAAVRFLRPWALRVIKKSTPNIPIGVAALKGQRVPALTEISTTSGQIKLAGEVWSARLADPTAGRFPPPNLPAGTEVLVTEIDGATAVVFPVVELMPDSGQPVIASSAQPDAAGFDPQPIPPTPNSR